MKYKEIDNLIEIVRQDMQEAPIEHMLAVMDALRELKSILQQKSVDNPKRHKYGEYKNVLLSDEELEKLKREFPEDWQDRIEELSSAIEAKGYKYRSHLAVIRNWARRQQGKNTGNIFLDMALEGRKKL